MNFFSGWSFSNTLWTESIPNDVLIGWSLGGLRAIQKCLEKPHDYQKLILINSTPYFSQFSETYWQMANEDLSHFQEQFLRWVFYPSHPHRIKNWQSHFTRATSDTQEALLEELYFLKNTDLRMSYEKLTLPILRIQSSSDALVPIEYFSLPNEIHTILSGSHALPLTKYEKITSIIRDFLCRPI